MSAPRSSQKGPLAYANWNALLNGKPLSLTAECLLYSDSHVSGELINPGPYQVLNTLGGIPVQGVLRPILALQYDICSEALGAKDFDPTKTHDDAYHGGGIAEEIASLLSLLFGIRLKAGPLTRFFTPERDARGQPLHIEHERTPNLSPIARAPILPFTFRVLASIQPGLFGEYYLLDETAAIAVARAARSYQNGIWIAEEDPSLSWLMLVSAVEIAADQWRGSSDEDPVVIFQSLQPDWAAKLTEAGGRELVAHFAKEWSTLTKSTAKFLEFLLFFLPASPPDRPDEQYRVSWDPSQIRDVFKVIYTYRSKALHGGKPFPYPMCEPPNNRGTGAAPSEVPRGLGVHTQGGYWIRKDTPIHLHVFEYIVREALLGWWKSLLS